MNPRIVRMAIYIDPPRWPAHGTVFSHLISDASLKELHAFARALGLHRRAFDEDHYDVHLEKYDAAITAGAIQVSGGELVRLLRTSGLRVPAKERIAATITPLRHRWRALGIGREELGEELLQRWSEPHRAYHTPVHLLHCLASIDELAARVGLGPPSLEVKLAAWFHDAVYDGVPGKDEQDSADLAEYALGGDLGDEVARLVLLTRNHEVKQHDHDGTILVDADLAILATYSARYWRYVHDVRAEYARFSNEDWRIGRSRLIRHFLDRERIFATDGGHAIWGANAKENLQHELSSLCGF